MKRKVKDVEMMPKSERSEPDYTETLTDQVSWVGWFLTSEEVAKVKYTRQA